AIAGSDRSGVYAFPSMKPIVEGTGRIPPHVDWENETVLVARTNRATLEVVSFSGEQRAIELEAPFLRGWRYDRRGGALLVASDRQVEVYDLGAGGRGFVERGARARAASLAPDGRRVRAIVDGALVTAVLAREGHAVLARARGMRAHDAHVVWH